MKNLEQPFLLKNVIKNYEWGQKGEKAFIPVFLGAKVKKNIPYAELWMGAHPSGSSKIKLGGKWVEIFEIIQKYPKEILGNSKKELSFLLKILSAEKALSIQVHPNKRQAEKLRKDDPKNYPDANQKNEIAIALTNFLAMVGFRPKKEFFQVFEKYPAFGEFISKDKIEKAKKANNFCQIILAELIRKAKDEKFLEETIEKIVLQIKKEKTTEEGKIFLELQREYGTDVGLLFFLLMNLIRLKPGEAVFLPSGILHAYIRGTIVECMSNSDNTIRAGLTPKFKDVENLKKIVSYKDSELKILKKDLSFSCADFDVRKIKLKKCEKIEQKNNSLRLLLITKGELSIEWGEKKKLFKKSQAILIPAILGEFTILANTDCDFFEVK
ncbi:MAG: mannose-6-phosphate isomerase, class I [Candidatus Moraniibacteriota bacterium]